MYKTYEQSKQLLKQKKIPFFILIILMSRKRNENTKVVDFNIFNYLLMVLGSPFSPFFFFFALLSVFLSIFKGTFSSEHLHKNQQEKVIRC